MPHRLFIALLLAASSLGLRAQHTVEPLSSWLATVDDSQHITLSWTAASDSTVWGYHICTGQPCLDYDTVFGRTDTTITCADHSPLEEHLYRIHVFDSAWGVSALTPSFGNMVLQAEVPECSTAVSAHWSAYRAMPTGVGRYMLLVKVEPYDSTYEAYYTIDSGGTRTYSFDLPDGATGANLRVAAISTDRRLVSMSNTVSVVRRTADTAAYLAIGYAVFDSLSGTVELQFQADTTYHGADSCTLWRSIDGSPWRMLATLPWPPSEHYTDGNINRYDSLHCYQLSVLDACGLNPRYSATKCVVVPSPPPPAIALPTAIIAGAEGVNGAFLPRASSMMGDIYELHIYDRRGILVFATTDPTEPWRPAEQTPQGAYTYALRLRFADNTIHTYVGTVTVIK